MSGTEQALSHWDRQWRNVQLYLPENIQRKGRAGSKKCESNVATWSKWLTIRESAVKYAKAQDHPILDLWWRLLPKLHFSHINPSAVGKVHGETERHRKWAWKVTMTTLWVAPTQTSLQVLEEKKGDSEQRTHRTWFPLFPVFPCNKNYRNAVHYWRWIEVLIPAWSMSAREN